MDFYTIKASKGFLYYMKDSIIKRIRVRALYKFLRGFEGFGGFRGLWKLSIGLGSLSFDRNVLAESFF